MGPGMQHSAKKLGALNILAARARGLAVRAGRARDRGLSGRGTGGAHDAEPGGQQRVLRARGEPARGHAGRPPALAVRSEEVRGGLACRAGGPELRCRAAKLPFSG